MNTAVAIQVEQLKPHVPPYGDWHVPAEELDSLLAERAYHRDLDRPQVQLDKKA
jgi:hypothetical protein